MPAPGAADEATTALRRRRYATLAALFVGYAGYYFCRAFFSSVKPALIAEFANRGIDKESLGVIASVGTLAYAVGKFGSTIVCDLTGGRRMFLLGMVGSALATVWFGTASAPAVFLAAWVANRLLQSTGWGALVKIASRWFDYRTYGRVMAVLSLSFVVGDGAAKLLFGWLLDDGYGWRVVCMAGAGLLLAVAAATAVTLRESPRAFGGEEPAANPDNLYADDGATARPDTVRALLRPFLASPAFWSILALSFGLTLVRDTFGEWLPLYLAEVGHLSSGQASTRSAVFPFCGAVSIVAVGFASDRLLGGRRGGLMVAMLALAVGALLAMSRLTASDGATAPVVLAAAVALLTMGPYSLLAGAIALDLGARRGSATASGMIDGAGYLSGLLSGMGVGTLAAHFGWPAAFGMLTVATALTTVAAAVYWRLQERARRSVASAAADTLRHTGDGGRGASPRGDAKLVTR